MKVLLSDLAEELYQYVKDLPIIDYHNHLSAADIAGDRSYRNITEAWISSDPYKHRSMRILGVPEYYITGNANDFEKFKKWYECIPLLAGNPLYDWSCMEFEHVLGLHLEPFQKKASEVWDEANKRLSTMTARSILGTFNIEYSAPCTGLTDDLAVFSGKYDLAPSLRGDTIVKPTSDFLRDLSVLSGLPADSYLSFLKAVRKRLESFIAAGCCYTDHALDDGFRYMPDDGKNGDRFQLLCTGKPLDEEDRTRLESGILCELGKMYAEFGLNLQLHIGARRITSTRLRTVAGPAGGYAGIGSCVNVRSLTGLLDDIEKGENGLPKVLLFTLNPSDNAVMSILSGSYSRDGFEAVVTQGPAWWWCDHREGIREMLDHFSVYSVLSTFTGMTTDSRSLFSFVRHDYFRRTLCQWMAEKTESGELPDNRDLLEIILKKICYENARKTLTNR